MNNIGMTKIANDINSDEYEKVSIDNFGKDMLKRMGWKENEPVKEGGPIKPVEFKLRSSRLGLGAEPLNLTEKDNKNLKKVEKIYGTKIRIINGKHKGLKGKIVDKCSEHIDQYLKEIKIVNVELKINKKIIKIEKENFKLRHKTKSKSRSRSRSKLIEAKNLKWVLPNIMVRIISKNSKYYNTKCIVVDLLDTKSFSLLMLEDKTIQSEFNERDLETVIPQLNENVIILAGKNRGEIGKLIYREKKFNKVSVQLSNDLSIENYSQDDVCAIE
jgi:hypothetical protein